MVVSIILPVTFFKGRVAAQRERIISLVDAVVIIELEAQQRADNFIRISFQDNVSEFAYGLTDDYVTEHYAVEARYLPEGKLRVQAWPRPVALENNQAAALSYFVDLSDIGKIINSGWMPKQDLAEAKVL